MDEKKKKKMKEIAASLNDGTRAARIADDDFAVENPMQVPARRAHCLHCRVLHARTMIISRRLQGIPYFVAVRGPIKG